VAVGWRRAPDDIEWFVLILTWCNSIFLAADLHHTWQGLVLFLASLVVLFCFGAVHRRERQRQGMPR
jgi:hypothetical protein